MDEKKRENRRWLWAAAAALTAVWALLALLVMNRWRVEIQMNGQEQTVLEYAQEYADPGARAVLRGAFLWKQGLELPMETQGQVDTGRLGDQEIVYRAQILGLWGQAVRRVTVRDSRPPEIRLATVPGQLTRRGEPYQEEGYTAWDNCDGDLTAQVQRQEEDGMVIYTVRDSSGNTARAVRPIRYEDLPPVLTLSGERHLYLTAGQPFSEPGYQAWDEVDGDLTAQVVVEGDFVPYRAGTFRMTYTVTDSGGHTAQAERILEVAAVSRPETVTPAGNTVYLTFDDGPSPYTGRLLDILDQYGVKATFFVTENTRADMIGEIYARGHSVGVHTCSHDYQAVYASEDAFFADFNRMREIIYQQTGQWTGLLRFPGGSSNTVSSFNPGIMTRLTQAVSDMGYQYFDWNVSAADSGGAGTRQKAAANVIQGIQGQSVSVVLQHDTREFSVEAVEDILRWGQENGYTFLPLDMTSPPAHHAVSN